MTVYVIQDDPKKNLTPASEFGDIRILLSPDEVTIWDPQFMVRKFIDRLADFNPDTDYLLLIGDPVAISIASVVVTQFTGGVLRLLKYDRQECRYNAVMIDFKGEEGFINEQD